MAAQTGRPERVSVGVNMAGYFDSLLGLGQAARNVRAALEAAGVPVAALVLDGDGNRAPAAPVHPLNLVCANAEGMEGARAELGDGFFDGRPTIGFWWWETGAFPERWLRAFDDLHELWVGSRHVADALATVSPVPVVRMPLPMPAAAPPPRADRRELGLPEGFLFLYTFDYASVFERKNPLAAIDAFKRAFEPGEGPRLVIKSLGSERDPEHHALLLAAAADRPDVEVRDERLEPARMQALVAACDCYVALFRSEGFGLTIAEAVSLGKPVIATAYSGPLDYLSPVNSYLVDQEPVPIGPGNDPYPADGSWAEPSGEHAARLMRDVVERPDEARRRGERGRADLLREHSPEAAGEAMARRLARVVRLPVDGERRPSRLDTDELARRVRAEAPPPPGGPLGRLRLPLRRLVLRLIRPQAVQQRHVDEELLRVIRSLDERVAGLAAAQGSLDAELRELRRRLEELE